MWIHPWCSAHEQEELCECWLWLLIVVCEWSVLVWLCWCCCAGDVVLVMLLVDWGSWSTSFTHSDLFILPPWVPVPWHLPACTWWLSCLLAGWLGRPAWSLADILRVSHVDKINTLMIINSVFPLICYCHLYYPWWHFSLHFLCLHVTRRIEKKGKKDWRSK
jgi:hypothetical protein